MSTTQRAIQLVTLSLLASVSTAQSKATVRGTVLDHGPVNDAEIVLQSLRDERCAKLLTSEKQDIKTEKKFRGCATPVATTGPDANGNFQFMVPKPGWYHVHLVWSIRHKPERPQGFRLGEIAVVYAGYKDRTGKYDSLASAPPFYFSGKEDTVLNLDLTTSPDMQISTATQQEESYMFGRIAGAVEDVAGGYTKEGLKKLAAINRDLEARQYSIRTRWLAHHWYAKALLDSGNPVAAISMLEVAKVEASQLTSKEQNETAELLVQAQKRDANK